MHIVVVIFAILFGLFWVTNAAIMLTSPKIWFRTPWRKGRVTQDDYDTRWGRVQIRIVGAVFLAAWIWIVYDAFLR